MKTWAVALAALAAGSGAHVAETDHYQLAVPVDFEPLLRLGTTNVTVGSTKVTRRSWGDVASGCAAAVHEVAVKSANRGAIFRELAAGLEKAGLSLEETAREDGDVRDRRYEVTGEVDGLLRVQARKGDPTVAVAALCFWTEREPASCRERCQSLLDGLEVRP